MAIGTIDLTAIVAPTLAATIDVPDNLDLAVTVAPRLAAQMMLGINFTLTPVAFRDGPWQPESETAFTPPPGFTVQTEVMVE